MIPRRVSVVSDDWFLLIPIWSIMDWTMSALVSTMGCSSIFEDEPGGGTV